MSYDAGTTSLNWTWTSADPDNWVIESSADGVTMWEPLETISGSLRTWDSGGLMDYFRVHGTTSGSPDTGTSNIVYTG